MDRQTGTGKDTERDRETDAERIKVWHEEKVTLGRKRVPSDFRCSVV